MKLRFKFHNRKCFETNKPLITLEISNMSDQWEPINLTFKVSLKAITPLPAAN